MKRMKRTQRRRHVKYSLRRQMNLRRIARISGLGLIALSLLSTAAMFLFVTQ